MQRTLILYVLFLVYGNAHADACIDRVEIGDPAFVVIEKCGEPVRREFDERKRSDSIEVVTGGETTVQRPHHPLRLERWYYDTTLNAATVIYLEDSGVTKKERLRRQE